MEAVQKMNVFYQSIDIDYLKEGISILWVARKFLLKDTKNLLYDFTLLLYDCNTLYTGQLEKRCPLAIS